eukprot:12909939-Prorocentrum_lima.AAC.1
MLFSWTGDGANRRRHARNCNRMANSAQPCPVKNTVHGDAVPKTINKAATASLFGEQLACLVSWPIRDLVRQLVLAGEIPR